MVELITSTIARDTWQVVGTDDRPAIGSITPFLLSWGLIVRHTPETHDKISSMLRKLRDLPVVKHSGAH